MCRVEYAGKDEPPPNGFRLGSRGIASNTQGGKILFANHAELCSEKKGAPIARVRPPRNRTPLFGPCG